ncbi:Z1 domain-containing protein [Propionibacteriaceae bacterium ES.041]|uniref:Z1 domain-containing protein n=1 Tax=Enemella evansiae TaxID=2016499 RepID=UPI000B9779C7|nr:Z1 domain-containing protein [Enemella evansiae]OYO06747.1 hypothetical protein CGZ95_00205 [Enemella evansiae]PFG65548.1 Z1 domain-containing protein [Propionibacteriaceae bacterium ES.041]
MTDRVKKYVENLQIFIKSGMSLEDAVAQQMDPEDPDLLTAAGRIRTKQQETYQIKDPESLDLAAETPWYPGPSEGDKRWARLKAQLPSELIESVDTSSDKVVSRLSDPHLHNAQRRGLVLGYVQSGKTANYAATICKAADAGYKLVIVLAGLHDNLRSQTQARLDRDLGLGPHSSAWTSLTTADQDFSGTGVGASVLRSSNGAVIAVVKKNKSRLIRLLNWLREIPVDTRLRCPVLLLDDEADQATPNSSRNSAEISAINKVLRQIWEQIPTGTYLAYTATPFANVFMDPDADDDLFPANFLISLPKPDNYFGAERIFGSEGDAEGSEPDPGLDMVRTIPDDEADRLRPSRTEKSTFQAQLPTSAQDAIRWFLVACAIRRARGQGAEHSSMLIHTSQFIDAHGAIAEAVRTYLDEISSRWPSGPANVLDDSEFREVFEDEADRASEVRTLAMPTWEVVAQHLHEVVLDVDVIIDNGQSNDRLDYSPNPEGEPNPRTVIAIGGQTLSRGLTLEGLIVSYFARPATTYDTLLQMGRWFGYRVGYEDLPRVWMTSQLEKEFLFLATVEQDLRNEIAYLQKTGRTPKDAGVRVREHPGRLSITNPARMQRASKVQLGLSHSVQQTIVFDPTDTAVIEANRAAASTLLADAQADGVTAEPHRNGRLILRDVSCQRVRELIQTYQFHENQSELMPDLIDRWLAQSAPESLWNIVIASQEKQTVTDVDGREVELGAMDLGLAAPVRNVSRAPMREPNDTAYIKALIGLRDRIADLEPPDEGTKGWKHAEYMLYRDKHANNRGLLIIFPISKDSPPVRRVGTSSSSRRPMDASDHLVGLGIVYPPGKDVGLTSDEWVSVRRYDASAAETEEEEVEAPEKGHD